MGKYAIPVQYGLIGGVLMIVILMLIYLISAPMMVSFFAIMVYLPLLFLMAWGGITQRKKQGGFATYGQAFLTVFLIAAIGSFIFDTYSYVLFTAIDKDLPAIAKREALRQAEAGLDKMEGKDSKWGDEMRKRVEDIRQADFVPTLKSQLQHHAQSLIVSVILSALIALFVRRNDREPNLKEAA